MTSGQVQWCPVCVWVWVWCVGVCVCVGVCGYKPSIIIFNMDLRTLRDQHTETLVAPLHTMSTQRVSIHTHTPHTRTVMAAQWRAVCPLLSCAVSSAPFFMRAVSVSTWSAIHEYMSAVRPCPSTPSTPSVWDKSTQYCIPLTHLSPGAPLACSCHQCRQLRVVDSVATILHQARLRGGPEMTSLLK